MRIKNTTPFPCGTKLTSRRPPEPEMVLVVRAKLALRPGGPLEPVAGVDVLAQGPLTADVFHDDDEARAGECLYPSDFADFKLRADVVLRGTCHTPGRRPMIECPVRFAVGSWSKTLRVTGPRVWVGDALGGTISDPVPFTKMPVDWAHAFGGPGFAANPAGKGIQSKELPNVEHPAAIVRSRGDRPAPASFGPINPAWPERSGKWGKAYGPSYKKRAPYYAEDFDWSHFNAAPADQQLDGHLRGDEKVAFHNLHPEHPVLEASLPGLCVRAFVKSTDGRFREVGMVLDTLFADLDAETITLTWRGVEPVADPDFRDVATVLVVSEPLGARRPVEEHRATLEAFEADPIGIREAMESMLGGGAAEAASDDTELDPVSRALREKLGNAAPAEQAQIREAMAKILAALPAESPARAEIERAVASADAPASGAPAPAPGAEAPGGMGEGARAAVAATTRLESAAAARGVKLTGIEKVGALAALAGVAPREPGRGPAPEPGPNVDLSGYDLTGRDLAGRDLGGANLAGAILAGAKLSGAKLVSANLRGAVLTDADLDGADLTGADLTDANASSARMRRALLRETRLDQTIFFEADLAGADLGRARGVMTVLKGAKLGGTVAKGLELEQADFEGALLEDADLRWTRLVRCLFSACKGERVDLSFAVLERSSFMDAELGYAKFVEVRGEQTIWLRAKLRDADFEGASLPRAHFTESAAERARFRHANLKNARFYRASLERADLALANLFAADLCRASLGHASFRGANLYDAKFLDAAGAGCDFRDANLKRSTLEHA